MSFVSRYPNLLQISQPQFQPGINTVSPTIPTGSAYYAVRAGNICINPNNIDNSNPGANIWHANPMFITNGPKTCLHLKDVYSYPGGNTRNVMWHTGYNEELIFFSCSPPGSISLQVLYVAAGGNLSPGTNLLIGYCEILWFSALPIPFAVNVTQILGSNVSSSNTLPINVQQILGSNVSSTNLFPVNLQQLTGTIISTTNPVPMNLQQLTGTIVSTTNPIPINLQQLTGAIVSTTNTIPINLQQLAGAIVSTTNPVPINIARYNNVAVGSGNPQFVNQTNIPTTQNVNITQTGGTTLTGTIVPTSVNGITGTSDVNIKAVNGTNLSFNYLPT